jgi:ferredoxin
MRGLKQNIIKKKLEQELSLKDGVVIVDEISCDGCGDCISACNHSAITIKTLSEEEVKELPFKGRLKVKIKGSDIAYINSEICTACGLCMKQCHEFAIHKFKN